MERKDKLSVTSITEYQGFSSFLLEIKPWFRVQLKSYILFINVYIKNICIRYNKHKNMDTFKVVNPILERKIKFHITMIIYL